MTKGFVFVSYGMGGAAIETWESGLRQLILRCKAAGFDTMSSPYQWSDVNTIAAQITRAPEGAPVGVIGASLGANEAPDVATRTKRRIRYLGGFQSSGWGIGVNVPANVDYADLTYNPGIIGWLRTLGMGSRQWRRAPGNVRTVVRNIPVYGAHPNDWGVAQDIIFAALTAKLTQEAQL